MKPVRVASDRWNFETAPREYITPVGGNILDDRHPVQGTLFARFDAAECDRRLGAMAEVGLNCLRQAIGVNEVFDPATGLKADGVKNWDKFIALAEKHGIYLMPVGGYVGANDWFDFDKLADQGQSLDESVAFWRAFAGHYSGHPAIWAWDLRNEVCFSLPPEVLGVKAKNVEVAESRVKAKWPAYLEAKYGDLAVMNRTYGATSTSFADVPGSIGFFEKPFDAAAYDFRRYLNTVGYAWCKAQCEALREVSPGHMICSGNNTWLFPDMDLWLGNGFHNIAVHDLFDFVTHHPYPAPQCLPTGHGDPLNGGDALKFWLACVVAMSRLEHYGKPVVMQEFGWYGGGESRFLCPLPFRSEQEHAEYTRLLIETVSPHTNGFINWPTMDMPDADDISNHGGIFTADARPKALAQVYKDIAAQATTRKVRTPATTTLSYSLVGLYTSRPYQDQMWTEIAECINSGEVPDFCFIA